MIPRGVLGLEPHYVEVVWGSDVLQRRYGKERSPEVKLGETWEISAMPGSESRVRGCAHHLGQLFEHDPAYFLGAGPEGSRFPMLVKLLSTSRELSVQVHPDDAFTLERDQVRAGKWECWTILEADDDAVLHLGLREGVDRDAFFAILESDHAADATGMLRRIPARPDQVWAVPTGTVHAIGAGITLLEVQEPSDETYRLHDWGRLDAAGAPRPLHLERGRAVLDAGRRPEPLSATPLPGGDGHLLLDEGPFRIERWTVTTPIERPVDRLLGLVCLDGEGRAGSREGAPLDLFRGRSCVVPAGATMLRLEGGTAPLTVAVVRARG